MASMTMLVSGLAMPLVAHAALQDSLCEGANSAAGTTGTACDAGGSAADPSDKLKTLAKDVTNWITIVVGALAVIMIIIGGFRYITSGGDSGKVGSAKNTIIYAIIGLIIVALAQIIVHFVVNQANESVSP